MKTARPISGRKSVKIRALAKGRRADGKFQPEGKDLFEVLYGKFPDSVVAAKATRAGVAVTRETIRRRRAAKDIPPFRPEKRWTAEEDSLMRKLKPTEAAAKLGISARAVALRKQWLKKHRRA